MAERITGRRLKRRLMLARATAPGDTFKINRFNLEWVSGNNKFGKYLHLSADSAEYFAMPGQQFVPYEVSTGNLSWSGVGWGSHPLDVAVGTLVGVKPFLLDSIGASTVFVTGVRTMRLHRSSRNPFSHQIEVMGEPTRWYAAGHFYRLGLK